VEGSGFLAQASVSRLGEISSNLPRLFAQVVAQATSSVLSESLSRSGEEVSTKRENVQAIVPHFSSSHLGERSSLERETLSPERDLSTWARSWARMHSCFVSSLFLDVWHLIDWITMLKHEVCEYAWVKMIYKWWMMSLAWSQYGI